MAEFEMALKKAERSMKTTKSGKSWMILVACLASQATVSGCAAMNRRPESLLPDQYTFRSGPFRIHTHKPIRSNDPMVAELDSLSRDVSKAIGQPEQPGHEHVDVYLLKDEASFRHYLKFFHPELPPRRAYFIATESSRTIYTFLGDHLMEDLRHEATHALVNLSHPTLPLWLDEGLAEVFEHPERSPDRDLHLDKFLADVKAGAMPDLARLEKITDVREMTPRDYRESWAWVRWGLAGPEPIRAVFARYIKESTGSNLAASGQFHSLAAMWNQVAPQLNPQGTPMVAWLSRQAESVRTNLATAPVDSQLRKARLQNAEPQAEMRTFEPDAKDPSGATTRKRGFLRRLFGF
ncbi:hypothetical protein GC170_13205 [bacterium]|nr:hypothetical protein [bacterium]